MSYLQIKNIKKVWNKGTDNEVHALNDISLSFEKGEFVSIVGSNASGKSTLFSIISGNTAPTSGEVFLDGKNITQLQEHRRSLLISKVKQDPNQSLVSGLTVEENFVLARKRGMTKKLKSAISEKTKKECEKLLAPIGLGIEKRLENDVALFSGGQRQSVALIFATLNNPELLLLDEHTAALDPKTSHKILELTNEIVTNNHITTLMVTHNITNALQYGNRLIVLESGKVKFDIKGEEKNKMSVADIISMIEKPVDFEEEFRI